jgi:glucose/mannose transport system substrate-binding protein
VVCLTFWLCTSCGQPASSPELDSSDVEIYSWWVSGGEVQALSKLSEGFEERFPGTHVVNEAAEDADNARENLARRIAQGRPPDTFQANIGVDLARWVEINRVDDSESKVVALDNLGLVTDWKATFPQQVLEAASYRNRLYGVPLNVHRENVLFYNREVFDKLELSPPTTLEELHTVAERIQVALDAGELPALKTVFSFGAASSWAYAILAFENLLVAKAGGQFYSEFFAGMARGSGVALAPEAVVQLKSTLAEFAWLWSKTNQDGQDETLWDEGVARLGNGAAAMTVMGDWAKGSLQALGFRPGVDFGQVAFPGTRGQFVFTADTFLLPKGAPHREKAEALLGYFASAEGQDAFNPVKGSIPARLRTNRALYDSVAQATLDDFSEAASAGTLLRALSGMAPSPFLDAVNAALVSYANDVNDPERQVEADDSVVLFALQNNYDRL